jgi:hypothetical protein
MIYAFGDIKNNLSALIEFISKEEGIFILPEGSLNAKDDLGALADLTKNEKTSIVAGVYNDPSHLKAYFFAYGEMEGVYNLASVCTLPCGSRRLLTQISVCSELFEWDIQNVDLIAHPSSVSLDSFVALQLLKTEAPVLSQLLKSKAIIATADYMKPQIKHPFTLQEGSVGAEGRIIGSKGFSTRYVAYQVK